MQPSHVLPAANDAMSKLELKLEQSNFMPYENQNMRQQPYQVDNHNSKLSIHGSKSVGQIQTSIVTSSPHERIQQSFARYRSQLPINLK